MRGALNLPLPERGFAFTADDEISASHVQIKAHLFRGIELAVDSVDIMAHLLTSVRFNPDNISLDAGIFAAEEANRLVRDKGIPFRAAYQQVEQRYSK